MFRFFILIVRYALELRAYRKEVEALLGRDGARAARRRPDWHELIAERFDEQEPADVLAEEIRAEATESSEARR